MAINKRVESTSKALQGVSDGAVVLISGFGATGWPNELILALRDLGVRDLTLVANTADHPYNLNFELLKAGRVRKVICTGARGQHKHMSEFEKLYFKGKIELELVPQGTFAERIRAGGAGIPAFYTATSFGTDLGKGKEVRRFKGRDYVMEHAITGDLALIGGHRADRYGNLQLRFVQANFAPAMATAARLVVAEVRVFSDEPLHYSDIQIPGTYVDRVIEVGEGRKGRDQ